MTEQQGLSLLDIAPQYEDVPIGDIRLRVYGITATDVVAIMQRFPETQKWFTGTGFNKQTLAEIGPQMLAVIIAAACRECGNQRAEDKAAQFSVEQQMDIIEAVGRLTFKAGFGPFVQRLAVLARLAASENSGRAVDTNSQVQSTPSSVADTIPATSGS